MYKEYTNVREHEGIWIATVYEYENSSMKGHPIKSYNEPVAEPDPVLPESKKFDTGLIHAQFDPSTAEYKAFCEDARISEVLNNQQVEISAQGIDFRKGVVAALEADSVITATTASNIQTLLDSWKSEVANA